MRKSARRNRGFRRCVPGIRRAAWTLGLMLCAASAPAPAAPGKCKLAKFAEFPVIMNEMSPETVANINGTEARMIVDTGGLYSLFDTDKASALGLKVFPAPGLFAGHMGSVPVSYSLTIVKDFTLSGVSLHNVEFGVVDGHHFSGPIVGILGRNFLALGDAEYDFAGGVARLMKAEECGDAVLAYWLRPGQSYSVINILKEEQSPQIGSRISTKKDFQPPVIGTVYLNGTAIRAIFDTGSPSSFLTVKAAAKAGIKVDSPGVVPAGDVTRSDKSTIRTYLAPVTSFKIGDEEIRNTRLRLGDVDISEAEMTVGADFFLSHHVYVANSQGKLYFSYNGGPVFDLTALRTSGSAPSAAAPAAAAPVTTSTADAKKRAEDASEYAHRGEALMAGREPEQALEAFKRACDLAPDNADYFYQRSLVYSQLKQASPALADLDRVIQLDPHHAAALLARAAYRTESGDKTGAEADLNAANAVLPKESNDRLTLAYEYSNIDLFQRAIEQYDLWTASHPGDERLAVAFLGRCRARTLGDLELRRAMKDCDTALRHAVKDSAFYAEVSATRGLLLFRLGDYDKSIADYDASLKIDPKNASALYARGIDKLRKQRTPDGQADIDQATALSPKIAQSFDLLGIAP
jgi:tetratricopeptide (TPR) repeat protein